MKQRGPKAHRGEIARHILDHARDSFAEYGYAATTLQGIARAAGVDTKLVRYYFTSKETLFAQCLAAPEDVLQRIRSLTALPTGTRGEAIVRTHLAAWGDPHLARILRTSLLIAAHEPVAMAKVRAAFVDGLGTVIGEHTDPTERATRAGLISAQLLGLAFARFVFGVEQAAAIPDEQVVTAVGNTVQRYLDGPL